MFTAGTSGHVDEHNRLAIVPDGIVADGVTDNAATINATLSAASDRTVFLPVGDIAVSEPIVVESRRRLIGGGAGDSGTNIVPTAGFVGGAIIETPSGADFYWHYSSVEDLRIEAAAAPPGTHGIHIYQAGENALLRNVTVFGAPGSGILLESGQAVMTIEHCGVGGNLDYGLKMSGGVGNVRVYGISGDGNRPGILNVDGGYFVEVLGLKQEQYVDGDPAAVVISGTGTGGARAKVSLIGCTFNGDGNASDGALVAITETARPSVIILGTHGSGWTNLVDDQVAGVQVSGSNPPAVLVYGSDGNERADFYVPNGRLPTNSDVAGRFRHQGSTLGFYNATAVARPAGVAVTAAGVHAALVSLGLITA